MIRHPGKLKKKRFDEFKAQIISKRRLNYLSSLEDTELTDIEDEDDYEADEEEFEDYEKELAVELYELGF